MNILDKIKQNRVDYDSILDKAITFRSPLFASPISVIIPIRGRTEFLVPLIRSMRVSDDRCSITVVEHDHELKHIDTCLSLGVSYVGIKCEKRDPFNKCLAHNVGAILSHRSDWLLFHDVDCLVQDCFFHRLAVNYESNLSDVFQSFAKKRVLYCSEELTYKLINHESNVNELTAHSDGITIGKSGAPGGSILISRKLFFLIGGYDPELFWGYSPEDSFFLLKTGLYASIISCNDIEVFHMHHRCLRKTNPSLKAMKKTQGAFLGLCDEDKMAIIEYKKGLLSAWS